MAFDAAIVACDDNEHCSGASTDPRKTIDLMYISHRRAELHSKLDL